MATVRVVQLCESIESVFRVNVATAGRQDLVRRWNGVGMGRVRPGEVYVVALRLRVGRGVGGVGGVLSVVSCVRSVAA